MNLKLSQYALLTLALTLLLNSSYTLWGQTSASQPISSSGNEFMVPKKEVNGKLIGQEDVLIQEVVVTDSGRRYRRLDVGVSGTIDGWAVKEASARHRRQFGSAPEFTFTQVGILDSFSRVIEVAAVLVAMISAMANWTITSPLR